MKLTFLGATGTVTGSKYLLERGKQRILVDCGLFQGHKELRLRNWDPLPINPASIDAVILTHAHIDHSGYLPLLVRNGFQGKVYCSEATEALCRILLPDSAFLHEEDARRANRYGYSKHHPALPLYTQEDAEAALTLFEPIAFGWPCDVGGGMRVVLSRSGHILGSAFVQVTDGRRTVVFSGDIGRMHDPIMHSPAQLQDADYLLVESTYGDRQHAETDPVEEIGEVVRSTVAAGGSVVIPAFAVGRAQLILYCLYQLKQRGMMPDVPVYLDSPMAISATDLFRRFHQEHKLSAELAERVCDVATYTRTVEASKAILQSPMPAVIISASGMATGGRVLHHLKHFITDARNTILFSGFQAGGTRGDRLLRGEKEIKIHGEMFPVRARIENLENMSAHGDYVEILSWLSHFHRPPRQTFITHGEPEAAASLKEKIENAYGWRVTIPEYLESVELD
ncbi:MAG: MBL fold metallo-hydrolase [Hyphomicrobiales bacterium]|nr:MBL fold metallo-hydrolase [Rickettsiales bacterium]MCP5361432.1 MBL fold metallo-hydrolase [Hyphomicrobiales bacterium]